MCQKSKQNKTQHVSSHKASKARGRCPKVIKVILGPMPVGVDGMRITFQKTLTSGETCRVGLGHTD